MTPRARGVDGGPSVWLRLLDRWLARRARGVLADAVGDAEAARLIDRAVVRSRERGARPRPESSVGGRIMVHAAALTAALYQELRDTGRSAADARRETARVTWAIYRQMARLPWHVARATARSPQARLRRAIAAFRRFPFGPPAYRMRDLPIAPDVVAFDVERCAVAEYFRERELGALCEESWCNLDFPLAKAWGGRLERSTTIAGGAARCDFRWRASAPDRRPE